LTEYTRQKELKSIPRLPILGNIDLTYRCNNDCLHCWLRIPPDSSDKQKELTLDEIRQVVDEARKMGTRRWSISGGEPMLRPDFSEFFDYITQKSISYSINTNGTFITPKIAKLMKRKGTKMVVLYGATAEVHDHITRNPGSFEAAMQGFAYLREAGAGFIVQLVPMKDNYHQYHDMIELAESLSPHCRVGAAWLYLSASGDHGKNAEIKSQRLPPNVVVELDKPDLSYEEWSGNTGEHKYEHRGCDEGLFAPCAASKPEFHVDPYGSMTFCSFIKDPALRYDLRKGNFTECWNDFLPSLKYKARAEKEYFENCGSCELRSDCRWCPVYGFLEHRSYSAKVDYLCAVAKENRKYKDDWQKNHRRYFKTAEMTILLESDLPITDSTFHPKFKLFEVEGPGDDMIYIRHSFNLPELNLQDLGREVYKHPPWAIHKKGKSWIYLGITPESQDPPFHRVAIMNQDHTRARIYNPDENLFRQGGLGSLTMFPSDQILLARTIAEREGCFFHASGVILDGKGLLFVGHSTAGKSTIAKMFRGKARILCDDRIIVRKHQEGFRAHGTWSHGDVQEVSADSAPLKAIFVLEKDKVNRIIPFDDSKDLLSKLLACLIKPIVTPDWWDKMLSLVGKIVKEVPCYSLHFDKSGKIVEVLRNI
jgi:radical SAM protein with 4Fe4S-binding SPASM domain